MCTIPNFLWDQLLEQAELTLNLFRQATYNTSKPAWEYLHVRLFNYDATPLGPLVTPVIIDNKPSRRKPYHYRGSNGFSAGVPLNHYRCQRAIDAETKSVSIMDKIEFYHHYLTQPSLTPQGRLIHALQTLTAAMHHASAIHSAQQLQAIYHLRHLFQACQKTKNHPFYRTSCHSLGNTA